MTFDIDRRIEMARPAMRGLQGFCWSCLLIVLSAWIPGARAENGRDFSAMYDLGPATALDPTHLSVKLFLRVQNHSGADLKNATIFLTDHLMLLTPANPLKSGLSLAYRATAKVSGTVTVGIAEYARWQRGGSPSLLIRVFDRTGRAVDRPIELMRMPSIGAMS